MRLIDAISLKKTFEEAGLGEYSLIESVLAAGVYAGIENAPTIDAVPVVRCRECKHHRNGSCPMRSLHVATRGYCIQDNTVDDGFCHMGAKMDGGAENGVD